MPLIDLTARDCHTRLACVPYQAVERTHGRFVDFCSSLSRVYGLPFPGLPQAKFACPCSYIRYLKKFCGGLIEGETHIWRVPIRRLSRRQRFAIGASLFLFRKILPSPGADLDSYMSTMSTPSPPPDPEFVKFCEERVEKIFKLGWDRNYTRLPMRVIPTTSSCVERGMGKGGQRALIASGDSWLNRQSFCEYALHSTRCLKLRPSRVVSVETGGKNRIVSTPTVSMNVLRPLHIAMYDHLSRFPWLLRGDAKPRRFKDFTRVGGEVFVSGDYESATDNLNTHIQELLLRKVCEQATRVPLGIRDTALASLRMSLTDCKSERLVVQSRGQLMGNLLSFPLLCLVNYLAFRFFVKRPVPVRINGDDIVFRARRSEAEQWMEGIGRSGLTLSKGKTLVSDRFFSLNSRFFEAGRAIRVIPVIRSKPFFGNVDEGVLSLRDRYKSCMEGFSLDKRKIITECFLRANHRYICASRRSVRNGLGIPCDQGVLERAGLFFRELCYLGPGRGRYVDEVPLSEAVKATNPYNIEGWVLMRRDKDKQVLQWQKEHAAAVLDRAWVESIGDMGVPDAIRGEEIRRKIRESGIDYSPWVSGLRARLPKLVRFLHLSRNAVWRWINPYLRLPTKVISPKCVLFYCPDTASTRRIVFVQQASC